ncbi:MAG: thermonuclease family protein [Bryobacterales bacterium]|nr:thermonuclease family protein [Bryobacteraceae bacterium]MDW8129144.1 thermonuclease family protein [Bryobacterales bacterium]
MRPRLPRRRTTVLAALLLLVLAGCRRGLPPPSQGYRVVRVLDGDTIEVLKDGRPARVRLYGIDTPERGQPFGNAARRFTGEQCFGRTVLLREYGADRYGRILAEVILPDGRVLNQELVRAGLAWWYREYAPEARELERLEREARAARRGLWADPRAVPPWEYRRYQGAGTQAPLRRGDR